MPGGHLSPYPAKVRERAVRSLISAGGVVLICPVGARTAAGRGWRLGSRRGRAACASKACPKQLPGPQGVCPASRSSHTIPAHQTLHPGLYHPTSGSPHLDDAWVGKTAPRLPRPQPPHSEDGQRSPPHCALSQCIFRTHLARRPPARSAPLAVRERPQHTLDSTPEQVVEAAPQLSLCTSSSTLS